MKPRLVIAFVLALLVMLFIVQNTEIVTVRFLLWQINLSRIVIIGSALVVGIILGLVFSGSFRKRKKILS